MGAMLVENFGWKKPKERRDLEDLGIDGNKTGSWGKRMERCLLDASAQR